jgi:hypothetical protein
MPTTCRRWKVCALIWCVRCGWKDRQQSLQLAGQAADLRVLTSATEALENLLKPAFVTAFDRERQNAIARAELSRIISGVLQFKLRVAGETLQREEQAAAQAAAGGGSTIEYIRRRSVLQRRC